MRRQRPWSLWIGSTLVALSALLVLGGAYAAWAQRTDPGWDPERVSLDDRDVSRPPLSRGHLLGTDDQGRDGLARLLAGGWRTIGCAAAAVALSLAIGVPWGLLAGYFGGRSDLLLMRAAEILMAFPAMVLAIVIVSVLGGGLGGMVSAVGIVGAPWIARQIRSQVLVEKELEYVAASRALGAPATRTLAREILPNCLPIMLVLATLGLGSAILEIAGLGFLGIGLEPGTPEWGSEIAVHRDLYLTAPWTLLVPAAAISATVLGFNLLADGLERKIGRR